MRPYHPPPRCVPPRGLSEWNGFIREWEDDVDASWLVGLLGIDGVWESLRDVSDPITLCVLVRVCTKLFILRASDDGIPVPSHVIRRQSVLFVLRCAYNEAVHHAVAEVSVEASQLGRLTEENSPLGLEATRESNELWNPEEEEHVDRIVSAFRDVALGRIMMQFSDTNMYEQYFYEYRITHAKYVSGERPLRAIVHGMHSRLARTELVRDCEGWCFIRHGFAASTEFPLHVLPAEAGLQGGGA